MQDKRTAVSSSTYMDCWDQGLSEEEYLVTAENHGDFKLCHNSKYTRENMISEDEKTKKPIETKPSNLHTQMKNEQRRQEEMAVG